MEMAVSLILLGVIVTAAYTFFNYGNSTFVKDNQQYTIQSNTRFDMDKIISEIKYSDEIYLIENRPTDLEKENSTYSFIYIENGVIYFSLYDSTNGEREETVSKGTYLLSDSYFSKDSDSIITLDIRLSSQYNSQTYNIDSKVEITNLNLKTPISSVQGLAFSKCIKYK
ncbi:hypothetical protein SDC9_157406 [bioreactor metagenome]|uniref:DUF4860 domain-containing protein n=1 Tax=bioreactor metagenome TaxID=1076179 RepID=A0A645FCM8_9ZZZZ